MTVSFLAGLGWLSATQNFVTVSKTGILVHPSSWQWPFWVCVAGFLIGLYIVLTTYHDKLPMFGRARPIDHSSMYSLAMDNFVCSIAKEDDASTIAISPGICFVNGGPSIIEYEIEKFDVTINGQPAERGQPNSTGARLLPGHKKNYRHSAIRHTPISPPPTGTLSYQVVYGPSGGASRYRRKHAVNFSILKVDPASEPPALLDWEDREPETDAVI